MAITTGTRLGPYEVISRIGAGGMGEVFKALDTRLDRSVAIKVLPPELTHDTQLKARFEREARTISQLTHPHICTLHDVGSENGIDYLVMELLEGETLAGRIERGPMPLQEVLRYGAQIADALGRAHRHGVIHRDLKPGNVMITKSGVKLLDFGLARVAPLAAYPDGATIQKSITQEGTILGTFQYMAPEQLEGTEADPRTDIFALGTLLYEMATGRRAFEAKTRTSLIAAIVSQQPRPLREVQPLTPPAFEHVVRKCLEKDPDDRWQSAQDISEELKWIAEEGSAAGVTGPLTSRGKGRERLAWALAALFAAATLSLVTWYVSRPVSAPRIVRVGLAVPNAEFVHDNMPTVAISPDGTRVAFSTFSVPALRRVWIRSLDRSEPTLLTQGRAPFFSPDGNWVGFIAGGKLRKIAAAGGGAIALANTALFRGAAWGRDGYIYYAPDVATGIWRVPVGGGEPKAVTTPDPARNENSHRWPQVLPDGRHLLMTIRSPSISSFDEARLAILSLDTGTWKTVLEGARFGRYVPTGHLVFAREDALHAVAFDAKTMTTHGAPVRVIERIESLEQNGVAHFAFSDRGDLVYVDAVPQQAAAQLVALSGEKSHLLSQTDKSISEPAISPDGRLIALRVGSANDDVWIFDVARNAYLRLTFEPGDEGSPIWSADGKTVLYTSAPGGADYRIVSKLADGSGQPRILLRGDHPMSPASCSPDGEWLAYTVRTRDSGRDVWLLSLRDGTRRPLVSTPFHDEDAFFSPNGKWITYTSTESGKAQIYARSIAAGGGRWQVSPGKGVDSRWSVDGRAIYYVSDGQFFRVDVAESADGLTFGNPQLHLKARVNQDGYDLGSDGRLITVTTPSSVGGATSVNLVENWFTDLRRRVPLR